MSGAPQPSPEQPSWIESAIGTGRDWLVKAHLTPPQAQAVLNWRPVPIRALGEAHRPRIAAHLLSLDARDRYLRFGYQAADAQIESYVERLDFGRDDLFGIFNRRLELLGMAHLAFATSRDLMACAEFGVSVLARARGRGYGTRLFERAVLHARNEGVSMLFVHALTENQPMLRIARSAGARVERDGADSEAYLQLPPATFDSRVSELVEERLAETDYHLKVQAGRFRGWLQEAQAVRQAAADAQRQSGP